jgi:hypothetical protein
MKSIGELKNIEEGKDIYVIASGPSMNLIPNSFFDGKVTIGVNEVYRKYDCKYYLRKEFEGLKEEYNAIKDKDCKLIVSERDGGAGSGNRNSIEGDYYFFRHRPNTCEMPKDLDLDNGELVVSWSTTTSAIHLAYFLGAKNIIICGHDCKDINGKVNYDNYEIQERFGKSLEWYKEWLPKIKPQTDLLVKMIQEKGINIFTLKGYEE